MEPATAYKRNTIQMGLAWCRDSLACAMMMEG